MLYDQGSKIIFQIIQFILRILNCDLEFVCYKIDNCGIDKIYFLM